MMFKQLNKIISFRNIDLKNNLDLNLAITAINLVSESSDGDMWTEEEVLKHLQEMQKYHQDFLAISLNSKEIGFARVGEYKDKVLNKQCAAIMDFAIIKEYQNKGIGTAVNLFTVFRL